MRFEREKYPDLPGVYLMKDERGSVIYVGKAISIRSRLSQHFQTDTSKARAMVPLVESVDFVVTKDGNEALILESNLIKNYQPRYNMLLKDAKHYSYLAITGEEFPRLMVARRNSQGKLKMKGARVFGPFTEGSKRAISARYLRKLFKIRICGKELPKKECLQFHLGNCDAPCVGKITASDYSKNTDALASVLEGKAGAKELISSLTERMSAASGSQDYEKAASLRDQIGSLGIFLDRQRVEGRQHTDEDFLFFQRVGKTLYVQILRSRAGVIGKTESHAMAIKEQEEPEISFCLQYYVEVPDKVYTNLHPIELETINEALKTDAFVVPGRDKAKVLEIAASSLIHGRIEPAIIRLKDALGLKHHPIIIETFDISTLFGSESVGSMVQFINGVPNKAGYRRFKIKSVEGQDDFAMMKEVVSRRYSRLLGEGAPMPDLVLIDGGAGQIHAAMDGMDIAGVRLPVAGLAKKEEEIYLPNRMEPLSLPRSDMGLKLLQRCRDEAHRFAVSYQRLRRKKKMKG
ncbi:MAG: excinuclease ABC subunit UvrC [Candidatus Micrarchaeota archaeon]